MRVNTSNSYIEEHNEAYAIFILLPDGSRNYIHSNRQQLGILLMYYQDIQNQTIGNYNTSIVREGDYFRIKTVLQCGLQLNGENNISIDFHSRLLNLNDAVYEYGLFIGLDETQ